MMFAIHATFGILIMGASCWASNIWPGRANLWRAALSRLLWWALPIALILTIAGSPPAHVGVIATAAWCGAWTPHTDMPDASLEPDVFAADLFVIGLRTTALLLPIGVAVWACGMFAPALIKATIFAIPAVIGGMRQGLPWRGARAGREATGILFGAELGFFLVETVAIPAAEPDLVAGTH